MRMPRVRFTIGRLMIAALVPSLTIWVVMISLQVSRTRRAEAAYKQAVLTREVAEYAVKEYDEGVFKQEKATLEAQIALARSDLERAIDQVADPDSKDRSTFDLEQKRARLVVLMKYTREKTIKELESEVQKARAAEKARREQYETERGRRKRLIGF